MLLMVAPLVSFAGDMDDKIPMGDGIHYDNDLKKMHNTSFSKVKARAAAKKSGNVNESSGGDININSVVIGDDARVGDIIIAPEGDVEDVNQINQ
ncbi:hypothetical protein [Pseudodesulfovibrio portus]|nr:hypothetical protein [Pseudodesulfovibrio portus]